MEDTGIIRFWGGKMIAAMNSLLRQTVSFFLFLSQQRAYLEEGWVRLKSVGSRRNHGFRAGFCFRWFRSWLGRSRVRTSLYSRAGVLLACSHQPRRDNARRFFPNTTDGSRGNEPRVVPLFALSPRCVSIALSRRRGGWRWDGVRSGRDSFTRRGASLSSYQSGDERGNYGERRLRRFQRRENSRVISVSRAG